MKKWVKGTHLFISEEKFKNLGLKENINYIEAY